MSLTFTQKVGGVVAIVVLVLAVLSGFSKSSTIGSVAVGNDYHSTTTGSFANASSTMIQLGSGTLGSIVIGVTSGTTFRLMDATSTSDVSSTTLASVAASPAIGSTMTFDSQFYRGLFIEFPASFVGRYTVTYR